MTENETPKENQVSFTFPHSRGVQPVVQVTDETGEVVTPDIFVNDTQVTVTFALTPKFLVGGAYTVVFAT